MISIIPMTAWGDGFQLNLRLEAIVDEGGLVNDPDVDINPLLLLPQGPALLAMISLCIYAGHLPW